MADGSKLSVDKIRSAIADILETEELESLTSRMVRNSMEKRFSVGLKGRKKEIDDMLMSMIQAREQEIEKNKASANGTVEETNESEDNELEDADKPPTKKSKKEKKVTQKCDSEDDDDDDDAEMARKLHQEEKGISLRTRKQPAKRKPKTTTKKTSGEKGKTGFGKMMILSSDLAKIVGADQMARSEVVKKMWQVIKERNLMDPKDKRFHICDDELLKVFGTRRVKTFSMMKYLKTHIKDPALIS